MKYFISLFVFALCAVTLSGQKNISVSGVLTDKATGDPVELANITLLNAKDSTFLAGEFSNKNGVFTLKNIAKGDYILKITYLGYRDFFKSISLSDTNLNENIGKLEMVSGDIMLQEAVVTGKAAEVVVKNDTIEYNADSYKTPPNSVVEDLLKKLPGVEVDNDGKITVNGKEVKKFLVDGKEFVSSDPKVASKNLPSEMIEKLQVVDRKSDLARMTGFDDGEEETVINLSIKQGMKQGLVGNAMAGVGQDVENDRDNRYEAAAMLNYMKDNDRYTLMIGGNNTNNMGASDLGGQQFGGMRGMRRGSGGIVESQRMTFNLNKEFSPKLSINGDVMFNSSDRNSMNLTEQTTLSGEFSQVDKTLSKNNDISDNFAMNFRLEWRPDSNNTLIFRPNFGYNRSSSDEVQLSERLNKQTMDSIFQTNVVSFNQGEGNNTGASLEYSHSFKKMGRILSIRTEGSLNDSYSYGKSDWRRRDFKDGIYVKNTDRDQLLENDNKNTNLSAYLSYVEPLGRNNFMQFAYEISQFKTESVNSTYDVKGAISEAVIDTAVQNGNQSRSTEYQATEQRYTLNFKSVREKYNYTIGFNIDPTYSINTTLQPHTYQLATEYINFPPEGRMPNIKGDSTTTKPIEQDIINFSPVINFNYLFGKRSNLRIDYSGTTTQPSGSQLRDYTDESNPNNQTKGNPTLKPGYTNQFSARFNKFVPESQFFYNFDFRGNFSVNDITQVTEILENGSRLTTYDNINGNWDTRLRATFNTPLKNKKITIGNFAMASYSNRKSYTNKLENTMKNLTFMDRANINYRSTLFDVGVNGMIRYSNITYDIQPENNQITLDWGAGAYTTFYLPHNFIIDSDINWTARSGYAEGFNIPEIMWNAAITKQIFNKKFGAGSLKLRIYDILQDRNNVSGNSTPNGFRSVQTTAIPSFFMCSFIYKFSVFPKGSSATENDVKGDSREGRGGWNGSRGGGRGNF